MDDILSWKSDSDITLIAALIGQNKVVLGSSDTVLGLLAIANEQGRIALDHVKQRNEKPYLILAVSNQKALSMAGDFKSTQMEKTTKGLMAQFWPGPLTIVLPSGLAVRVPNHSGLLKLLAETGLLYSTSANITGQPVPERLTDIDPSILASVAAVIDNDAAHYPIVPSTIVDCSGKEVKVIRAGAIPADEVNRTK